MRKRDAIKKGHEKAVADHEKSLAFYHDGMVRRFAAEIQERPSTL